MRLQFLGSGDAFGSGGRFNMCILVESEATRFLVDCGASSLIAMKRLGVSPNSIDTILITHLHADHFGGLPFFILNEQFSKRRSPLTIAGPPGLSRRLPEAMDVFFPESSKITQKFDVRILELKPGAQTLVNDLFVTPYVVSSKHVADGPSFALRVEVDGRIFTYSGDADWCAELAAAAHEADLFVCEAYFYEKEIKYHINLKTLEKHLPEIRPKRLILTHMSDDMLDRSNSIIYEMAEDGKVVDF
ncbi:MAG: MBL fold metallo-hydrolase [Desulfomonilaceae bacterium]